jgi:hypothetical protein
MQKAAHLNWERQQRHEHCEKVRDPVLQTQGEDGTIGKTRYKHKEGC